MTDLFWELNGLGVALRAGELRATLPLGPADCFAPYASLTRAVGD